MKVIQGYLKFPVFDERYVTSYLWSVVKLLYLAPFPRYNRMRT